MQCGACHQGHAGKSSQLEPLEEIQFSIAAEKVLEYLDSKRSVRCYPPLCYRTYNYLYVYSDNAYVCEKH